MTLQKYSEIHYIDWMEMYKLDTIDDTSQIFWDTLYRLNGNGYDRWHFKYSRYII